MEWMIAIYPLLKSLWVVWFMMLFVGIAAWAFWPTRQSRLQEHAHIPFRDADKA